MRHTSQDNPPVGALYYTHIGHDGDSHTAWEVYRFVVADPETKGAFLVLEGDQKSADYVQSGVASFEEACRIADRAS